MENSSLLKDYQDLTIILEKFKQKLIISNNTFKELKERNKYLENEIKQKEENYNNLEKKYKNILNELDYYKNQQENSDNLNKNNNSKNDNDVKSKKSKKRDKYSHNELSDTIILYNKTDINKLWKNEIISFTHDNLKKYILIDYYINDDIDINKEDYREVIVWLNKYEINKENIKNNYNIKRKIKRCKLIHQKYGEKIKFTKFNINSFSYMKNDVFEKWLSILDDKINTL